MEPTTQAILVPISLWFILLIRYSSQIKKTTFENKSYFFFWLIVTLFCTFNFMPGDYYSYKELYENLYRSSYAIHVEEFFYYLTQALPHSYHLWRFIIWTTSTIIIISIFKKLKCPTGFSVLVFTLLLMTYFAVPRNTLGFVVLYLAIVIIFSPNKKNKFFSLCIGSILIIWSFSLHKSMFIYILLMGFALIPLGKKLLITSIIAFPLLYKSVTFISSYILLNSFANETSQESGTGYLESDFRVEVNINGLIQLFITRLPIFLLLFYSIRNIFFKKESVHYILKIFLQYSYWLIYISYLFMGQEVSAFLSNRFWDASLYPLTFFIAGYLYKKPRSRFIKNCFYLLILSNLYQLSYAIFKTL